MAVFTFRAQAALDFRRRQEEEAQRTLGEARRAVLDAKAALARAEAEHAEALHEARRATSSPAESTPVSWHRNWILLKQREIGRRRQTLAEREQAETRAVSAAMQARRKVRSLEKLRERFLAAFELNLRRQEQKVMDELGGLRYVARGYVPGGR